LDGLPLLVPTLFYGNHPAKFRKSGLKIELLIDTQRKKRNRDCVPDFLILRCGVTRCPPATDDGEEVQYDRDPTAKRWVANPRCPIKLVQGSNRLFPRRAPTERIKSGKA